MMTGAWIGTQGPITPPAPRLVALPVRGHLPAWIRMARSSGQARDTGRTLLSDSRTRSALQPLSWPFSAGFVPQQLGQQTGPSGACPRPSVYAEGQFSSHCPHYRWPRPAPKTSLPGQAAGDESPRKRPRQREVRRVRESERRSGLWSRLSDGSGHPDPRGRCPRTGKATSRGRWWSIGP